jgi:hypothetical protein
MKNKIVFILITVGYLAAGSMTRQGSAQEPGNFSLVTNPPGATAFFHGEYDLVVNTPANLPSDFTGNYKVRIVRPGYEAWNGELSFTPEGPNSVNINLSRKTRLKSGLRSLFIPGWGQHYSGNSTRGTAFTIGAIAFGGVLIYADKKFRDKRDSYEFAFENYKNAPSIDDKTRLFAIYNSARETASKAETDRNRIFYAGLGLWVYNIFDSMIFFPSGSAYFPTITATGDGGAELSFTVRF